MMMCSSDPLTTARAAYYGCWDEHHPGHFLYNAGGMTLKSYGPFIPESLDGVLLRGGQRIRGQVDVTCFKDYTVISSIKQRIDDREAILRLS